MKPLNLFQSGIKEESPDKFILDSEDDSELLNQIKS